MIHSWLPSRGSVLLFGRQSQMQAPFASAVALSVAAQGRNVVFLTDTDREANQIVARADAQSFKVHAINGAGLYGGTITEGRGTDTYREIPAVNRLVEKIAALGRVDLIVRDISDRMAGITEYEPWLPDAGAVAYACNCPVLTVAAHVRGELDLTITPVNEAWSISTYHDKIRQNSSNVRITRLKPANVVAHDYHATEGHLVTFTHAEDAVAVRDPLDQSPTPSAKAEADVDLEIRRADALKAWRAEDADSGIRR